MFQYLNIISMLQNLGVVTIFSSAIVYLAKQITQQFINRNFKAYELELQHKSDEYKHGLNISLEKHKSELNLLFIKSSKLHDQRLIIIKKLYKHLVNLEYSALNMTKLWQLSSGNAELDKKMEDERVEKAGSDYNKFSKCYSENKIFFSSETCNLLDEIRTHFYDSHWDYTSAGRFGLSDGFTRELAIKASDTLKKNIPPVLKELEKDFRNTLVV